MIKYESDSNAKDDIFENARVCYSIVQLNELLEVMLLENLRFHQIYTILHLAKKM